MWWVLIAKQPCPVARGVALHGCSGTEEQSRARVVTQQRQFASLLTERIEVRPFTLRN